MTSCGRMCERAGHARVEGAFDVEGSLAFDVEGSREGAFDVKARIEGPSAP